MTNNLTDTQKTDAYASKMDFSENVMNTCVNRITKEEILKNGTSMNWQFIINVRKHVEKNIGNQQFNVDMLCSLMGMSRTSFYNKLKSLTDQAPADYIRLIRLEYAIRLLREGEHNITEISEMTGFNDARYFRQVFKKYFKISPSQYSKKIREHR